MAHGCILEGTEMRLTYFEGTKGEVRQVLRALLERSPLTAIHTKGCTYRPTLLQDTQETRPCYRRKLIFMTPFRKLKKVVFSTSEI